MSILEMSLQASVMIVLIALARALAVNRLPKWGFQALWGIVVARLLMPMRVEFHLSAYNAVQQFGRTLSTATPLTTAPLTATPIRVPLAAVEALEPARAAVSEVAPALHISPWFIAWLIGATLLLTYFVITHLRWRKLYAQARTLSVAREGAFRGPRRVSVKVSNSIDSPLTYGVLRPVILMPEGLLNRPEYGCALDHELIHVRHWDALKKWLLMITLCTHWFNPLVWVMYILANRDIEMYCDNSLLRAQGGGRKAWYASMLLDLEEARTVPAPLVSHFGRNAIEERVGAIMRYRKTSILGVILALTLVIFTAALATSAVTPAVETTELLNSSLESAEASADAQSEVEIFAHYAPFGLVYKSDEDQFYNLYYKGEKVRYFEDTVHLPNGESPTYCSMSMDDSGSVDVRTVRDPSKRRVNPDGSFDPWEELAGLEPFPQAEFDARTAMYAVQREARETEGGAVSPDQVEWWTAEGYEAWLNQQRVELPRMIGSRGWNQRDGWFTWTQEMVDERITIYERTLEDIKKGYLYSESVGGDGYVAVGSGEPYSNISASAMAHSAAIPTANVGSGATDQAGDSGDINLPEDAELFAPYARFGLTYDKEKDRLYYGGQLVRYFEDSSYPFDKTGHNRGMVTCMNETGIVDTHAVWDASRRYGSGEVFDPWQGLTGVEAYTRKEFDVRTADLLEKGWYSESTDGGENAVIASGAPGADGAASATEEGVPFADIHAEQTPGAAPAPSEDQGPYAVPASEKGPASNATDAPVEDALSEYSRKAWKMDYENLLLNGRQWYGKVFLCKGPIVEILRDEAPPLIVMNVGTGEAPQYVILDNVSLTANPSVGVTYTVYADVAGNGNYFYGDGYCPRLTARYILASDDAGDGWTVAPENYTADEIQAFYALNAEDASEILYQYRVSPLRLDLAALAEAYYGGEVSELPSVPSGDGDIVLASDDRGYALYRDPQNGTIQLRKPSVIPLQYREPDASITEGFGERAVELPTPSPQEGKYTPREAAGIVLEFLKDACGMDTQWLTFRGFSEESAAKEKSRVYQLYFTYMLDGRRLLGDAGSAGDCSITAYVTDEGIMNLSGNLFRIVKIGPVPSGELPMPEERVLRIATQGNHPPYGEAEICYYLSALTGDGAATWAVWSLPILDLEKGECFGYELRDGITGEELAERQTP